MLPDYKNLIPQFENSPVMNKLLDAINGAFAILDRDLEDAFDNLNIDKCNGEWLDNLGDLVGVRRPVLLVGTLFLQSDNYTHPLDESVYYVMNATLPDNKAVGDEYFRMLIRAQIIRNNMTVYSINVLENLVRKILFNDLITLLVPNFSPEKGALTLSVNSGISTNGKAFLQSFTFDKFSRKKWAFPWPSVVQTVTIQLEEV
jgi:hypothetical protein